MKSAQSLVLVFLVVSACSKSPVAPDAVSSPALAAPAMTAVAGGASGKSQTADLVSTADGTTVYGSARLMRSSNGVTATVATTGLVPGEVYTLWWIIDEPGGEIVTNAAGTVVDQHGRAHFGAHLGVGPVPPEDGSVTLVGGSFDAPLTATVVLVVHHHGPKVPGIVGKMLSTFGAGCVNGCADDPQFAVFTP